MTATVLGIAARSLTLVALATTAGLLLNALRPDGVAFSSSAEGLVCTAAGALPAAPRLTPAEANALCAQPGVLIADARTAQRFAEGHVAGAVHLPCAAPGLVAAGVNSLLQGRHTVIVYADTSAEADAVADGIKRREARPGLSVLVLDGGFPAWALAGFACVSGACADCEAPPR